MIRWLPDGELGLPVLFQQSRSAFATSKVSGLGKSAIHSGKLGDIIYALPACRELGVDHLVLNVYLSTEDPLRIFPLAAAREIVPLLLYQSYLRKVSIVSIADNLLNRWKPPGNIDFNFDLFRGVARHRAGKAILRLPSFARFRREDPPAHLVEMFAASQGITVPLAEPWLTIPRHQFGARVALSITKNWRTYPDVYWRKLLSGMPNPLFVGHEQEYESSRSIVTSEYVATKDHFELASLIAGAELFLGTVSFPYALAEGLKSPRAVEVCHRNLNAFPIGERGTVLPPDVIQARTQIAGRLPRADQEAYRAETRRLAKHPAVFIFSRLNTMRTFAAESNHGRFETLRIALARWKHAALSGRIFARRFLTSLRLRISTPR